MEDMQRDMMKQMEQMAKSGKMPTGMPDMKKMEELAQAAQRGEMGKVQEALGQMIGSNAPTPFGAALGASPSSVKLYDVNAGREVRALTGPPTMMTNDSPSIAFSPDGRVIAT